MTGTAPSETIDDFCRLEKISRGTFYNLQKHGKGPRLFYIGRHPRIAPEEHARWRREQSATA